MERGETLKPFAYRDKGSMAIICKHKAVVEFCREEIFPAPFGQEELPFIREYTPMQGINFRSVYIVMKRL